MGLKIEEKKAGEAPEEKEEDSPVVVELKKLDDEYLALEREMEKELFALEQKYAEKKQPLLDDRSKMLREGAANDALPADADKSTGTPYIKGFWLKALQNHPAMEDLLQEHDAPVLEYLSDITSSLLSKENKKSFRLDFHFAENPYFTNDKLWKEYYVKEECPYRQEDQCQEMKACTIDWKAGKDVTVETIKKKVKGGGAKKAKDKGKEKQEPRPSFFRDFFRVLKVGDDLPDDVDLDQLEMEAEDGDPEDLVKYILDESHGRAEAVKDNIVPFAVRWYTGEASPEDDFDEDSEEEDDEEDESEDDEDESEDSPSPKKKAAAKGKAGAKKGGEKQEECKQQ